MTSFWLEQIWTLSEASRQTSAQTGNEIRLNSHQIFILRCYLDAFIFEARAYLDLFMLYILLVLKPHQLDPKMHMKTAAFMKALDRVHAEPTRKRAEAIKEIFQGDDVQWIDFLKSLRNRIAHRDILAVNFEGVEGISSSDGAQFRFNWPTIKGRTYDRLCQDFENGIFFLITEVFPVLFDIEWKPGPYVPGMFGE